MCTLCSTPTRPFVGPRPAARRRGRFRRMRRRAARPGSAAHRWPGPAGRGQRRARSGAAPLCGVSPRGRRSPGPARARDRGGADAGDRPVAAPDRWRSSGSGRRHRRRERTRRGQAGLGRARQRPRPHRRAVPRGGHSCPARRSSPYRQRPGRAPRRRRSPCSGTTAGSGCSSTPISSRAACSSIPSCCSGCRRR